MQQYLPPLIIGLTPVLVPLLVAALKTVLDRIPSVLLPIVAVGLGVGLDALNGLVTGQNLGPIWGAVLGGAGVAVREILDQVKKMGSPQ